MVKRPPVMQLLTIGVFWNGCPGNGHYLMIKFTLIGSQIMNIIGSLFLWMIGCIMYMLPELQETTVDYGQFPLSITSLE